MMSLCTLVPGTAQALASRTMIWNDLFFLTKMVLPVPGPTRIIIDASRHLPASQGRTIYVSAASL